MLKLPVPVLVINFMAQKLFRISHVIEIFSNQKTNYKTRFYVSGSRYSNGAVHTRRTTLDIGKSSLINFPLPWRQKRQFEELTRARAKK
jgi:hypothetical protein